MKVYDTVNKVELEATEEELIKLMAGWTSGRFIFRRKENG